MRYYKGDKCCEITCGDPQAAILAKPVTIEDTREACTAESVDIESDMMGFVRPPLVKIMHLQGRPWYNHLRGAWDSILGR